MYCTCFLQLKADYTRFKVSLNFANEKSWQLNIQFKEKTTNTDDSISGRILPHFFTIL